MLTLIQLQLAVLLGRHLRRLQLVVLAQMELTEQTEQTGLMERVLRF